MFEIFSNGTPKAEKEETGYVTVRVPVSLRDEFNALCAKHGMSASEAIRKFMTQALAEAKEKEAAHKAKK